MSATDERASRLARDAAARRDALDCTRSFLVQAPAGSGKTELLTQRLLALLARVDRPERIVAATFTRKAAGEMRERVVRALVEAGDEGVDASGLSEHKRLTRKLAQDALAQDRRQGWRLAEHPARLAIHTLDALAQAITQRAPLASGVPPSPRLAERAEGLYLAAAREAIHAADPDDPAWRALLGHRDNDADDLVGAIAGLLAQRDQWLALLEGTRGDARAALERALAAEIDGELAVIAATLPADAFAALPALAPDILPHLGAEDDEPLGDALMACIERGAPPPFDAGHVAAWRAIAEWLLKKGGDRALRANAQKMRGLPAKKSGAEAAALVDRVVAWLEGLREAGAEPALQTMLVLPVPRYEDASWATIAALLDKLPECAARLETVFAREGAIDFPRLTLGALAALGTGEAPSDLLLRLDYAIQHLLIDEFQDTSYAQLELIGRLVAGWSPGDGRTIFAVGDPMQSIYRFRGAEVRAFIDAQARGDIEGVPVEPLALARNFRSQAGLVDWVNARFPRVMGAVSDPWQGRVAFAPAEAHHDALDGPACAFEAALDEVEEARRVVARVRVALAEDGSIAILARQRGHLATILPALRAAGIAYAALDLDSLADRAAVRDAASLLWAILQPDDRLSWLALLRSPLAGLDLADLDAIVRTADARPSRAIEEGAVAAELSPDGAKRAARVLVAVARARDDAPRLPLADRTRRAWLDLDGPATLDDALDLEAIDALLALVAERERGGDLVDRDEFSATLAGQRIAPSHGASARVSVLTMHKAKGLEFDTVILPGLARGRGGQDRPLLRWRVRRDGLVVGIAKPRGGGHDNVFRYLASLAQREEAAEVARTAYVAWTRARRRIVLFAVPGVDDQGRWKAPAGASLLGRVDPDLVHHAPPPDGRTPDLPRASGRPLERLPIDWARPASEPPLASPRPMPRIEAGVPFDWARERARRLGVVVHALLARVDDEGLDALDGAALEARRARIESALVAEGALPADARAEGEAVRATIAAIGGDPRGRWIFDPAHVARASEWALGGVDDDAIVHVTLDRTFVCDGERWIVDFKTGTHEGGDPAAFLDAEAERYAPQLRRYARIVSALDPRPIRLALYHPRVPGGWREIGLG